MALGIGTNSENLNRMHAYNLQLTAVAPVTALNNGEGDDKKQLEKVLKLDLASNYTNAVSQGLLNYTRQDLNADVDFGLDLFGV